MRKKRERRHLKEVDQSGSDLKINSKAILTWENLCYDVPTPSGQLRLLKDIFGYVVPGQLTALMGTFSTQLDIYVRLLTDSKVHPEPERQLCSTSSRPEKTLELYQVTSLLMGSNPELLSREELPTPSSLMYTNPLRLYERLFGFLQTFDSRMQFHATRNMRTLRRSSHCWRWRI